MKAFYSTLIISIIQITFTVTAGEAPTVNPNIESRIEKLPLIFRQNLGQWDDQILFSGISKDANVFFLKNGLSFGFLRPSESKVGTSGNRTEGREMMVWNMNFENVNPDVKITSSGKQNSTTNYIRGNDPSRYAISVPDYSLLKYHDIYKNIDLRYYVHNQTLKYDYILKPGANIKSIRMQCDGIRSLDINRKGELEIETPWGILLEKTPYSYQVINGEIREVDIRFDLLDDKIYGFRAHGPYDDSKPLIIDPIILQWATFVGGLDVPNYTDPDIGLKQAGRGDGYAHDLVLDKNDNIYVAGFHNVAFFTTPGVYDESFNSGYYDAIVFKMKPDGSGLYFATFIGGNHYDCAEGIAIDKNNNIYVAGWTASYARMPAGTVNNFPTTANAFDRTFDGGPAEFHRGDDIFVLKLDPTGTSLKYSTLVGGNKLDEPARGGISVNDAGEVFVSGLTRSSNFPTTAGAFDRTLEGESDAFVFRLNATGSKLIYSTLIGGSGKENDFVSGGIAGNGTDAVRTDAGGIVINSSNEAYITGWTNSDDFPVQAPLQSINGGGDPLNSANYDMFVTRINASGTGLIHSTYIGGNHRDAGMDLTLDSKGNIYVVGSSMSANFPIKNAFDPINTQGVGTADAVILKLNPNASQLIYSTFMGERNMDDIAAGIAVNKKGEAFVTGITMSPWSLAAVFPTTSCAFQKDEFYASIYFVAKFSAMGKLMYSSMYSGDQWDYQPKIALIEREPCIEEVVISAGTHSYENTLTTTPGSYQPNRIGTGLDQPFVFRLKPEIDGLDFSFTTPQCNQAIQFTDLTQGSCVWDSEIWKPTSWHWDFGDGTTSTLQHPTHSYTSAGEYKVTLRVGCPNDSLTKTIKISGGTLNITPQVSSTASECGKDNGTTTVSATGGTYNYQWDDKNKQTTATATGLAPGTYNVTIGDPASCKSTTASVNVGSIPEAIEATASSTPSSCGQNDGTATVTANGGSGTYTYLWNDGNNQTTAIATGLPPGSYHVTVKDEQGCPAETTVTVVVNTQGNLQVSATATTAKCGSKGSATITAGGGDGNYSFQWDNAAGDQTTATATGLIPGTYHYTVTDESGCTGIGQVTIKGEGNITTTTVIDYSDGCDRFGGVNGTAVALPAGGTEPYTYQWDDANQQTTDSAKALPAGMYNVLVTDSNGCTATAQAIVEERIQLNIDINIQPSCSTCTDGQVTVNIGGFATPPYTLRWNDENQQTTATATGLKPGTYMVTVFDDKDCSNTDTVTIGGPSGIIDGDLLQNMISIYPNPNNGQFYISSIKELQEPIHVKVYDLTGKIIYSGSMKDNRHIVSTDNLDNGIYLVEIASGETRITRRIQVIR